MDFEESMGLPRRLGVLMKSKTGKDAGLYRHLANND